MCEDPILDGWRNVVDKVLMVVRTKRSYCCWYQYGVALVHGAMSALLSFLSCLHDCHSFLRLSGQISSQWDVAWYCLVGVV